MPTALHIPALIIMASTQLGIILLYILWMYPERKKEKRERQEQEAVSKNQKVTHTIFSRNDNIGLWLRPDEFTTGN